MSSSVLEKCRKRKAALWQDRTQWDAQYKNVAELILPRAGQFFTPDSLNRSSGTRWDGIYDSSSVRPLRILAAGMMSGLTSPARPWFRLTTPDAELMEYEPVKLWLEIVTKKMRDVFMRSNTYRSLHSMYEELGAFGTAACPMSSDYDTIINCHPLTVGEYALATDHRGLVNTIYREFELTTEQMVGQFGLKGVSIRVKTAYDNGNYYTKHSVVHGVEPREQTKAGNSNALNKKFRSIYYDAGDPDCAKPLRESGFDYFPALCPRWVTTGQDVYGTSPGMEAIGDARQLQHQQLRKGQAIDFMTKPPLQAPSSFKNQENNMFPGGISFVDMMGGQNSGIKTAFETRLDLSHLLGDMDDVRNRLNSAFYADLFLMLANDTRSGITAREVAERHEEKMLMLGPVLERLHNEMLDPLIDFAFREILNARTSFGGIVPPPPKELQGMDLRVELVSTLAQAQRAVGVQSIDRLLGTVGVVAQFKPEVLDKLDGDQIIDIYSDMLGVDPSIIVGDARVAILRSDRAEKQQQQEMMSQMAAAAQPINQVAQAAKNGAQAMQGMSAVDPLAAYTGYS